MERTYIPKWFELYELMPPELYTYDMMVSEEARERAFANYFDPKLLETIDVVREIIGFPLICNTWFQDGNRRNSGYRTLQCEIGAAQSQHKLGKAVDLICHKMSAEDMRQKIEANKDKLPHQIRIERGTSWLHLDTKGSGSNSDINKKIIYFNG